MITRFQGEVGRARLVAAMRAQKIVSDDEKLADELANEAALIQVDPGKPDSTFIEQGASDNEIFFVLSGKVSVRVNGREVAVRESGSHMGEMALIDPAARRSASVIAVEQTVLARVSEAAFSAVAQRFPHLWRRLALELAERLRQRGRFVSSPNPRPVLFVGSSAETLAIAREIQSGFAHDNLTVTVWTDGVFRASKFTIESLLTIVRASDFAVLLVTPDDVVVSRDVEQTAPRDNVIFELGLFMGVLGRERTFIVRPRGAKVKTPSDLLGLTPLEYATGSDDSLPSRIAPVCNDIRKIVRTLGSV